MLTKEEGKKFLPARDVCARYGVVPMTIYRWLNDPEKGFPRPVYIGRCRYWRLEDLEAFERGLATEAA